jgi:leucyl-tRNA synthetase
MDLETAKLVHRTVKKVGEDIEALRLNTAVSAMMILANHLNGLAVTPREAVEKLVLCLAPYAPHLGEELWAQLGSTKTARGSVLDAPWPSFDPALCVDEVVEVAVQVNGKVRGRASLARDASEDAVYVPGRIVNLSVG